MKRSQHITRWPGRGRAFLFTANGIENLFLGLDYRTFSFIRSAYALSSMANDILTFEDGSDEISTRINSYFCGIAQRDCETLRQTNGDESLLQILKDTMYLGMSDKLPWNIAAADLKSVPPACPILLANTKRDPAENKEKNLRHPLSTYSLARKRGKKGGRKGWLLLVLLPLSWSMGWKMVGRLAGKRRRRREGNVYSKKEGERWGRRKSARGVTDLLN